MENLQPKILIADFFGTVKERGIAAYVRDLEVVARPMAETVTLRAPLWVRRLPQSVQNILMVLHEQIVVPLHALVRRPDLIVFPYNSSSFLLSLSPRTVCVIHDLIPYKRRNRGAGLAFLYIACTIRWHARMKGRLIAVSSFTSRILSAIEMFKDCSITTIPNCFSAMPLPAKPDSPARRRVTLISGVGHNKDFRGALELMAGTSSDRRLAGLAFDIVGFGPECNRAEALIAEAGAHGLALPSIDVHGLLPRTELDALIAGNSVTWAHSLAEGFGRVVVEGRMAGRPVVMSQLAVFRALRDPFTFSYRNNDQASFREALSRALEVVNNVEPYEMVEKLRADAAAGLQTVLIR